MNSRVVILILFSGTLILSPAAAPDFTRLSMTDCIRLALKNNPQLLSAEGVAEAGLGLWQSSRSGLLPQLFAAGQLSTVWGETSAGRTSGGTSSGAGLIAGFQAQQLLFDFWKTPSRARAGYESFSAARHDSAGLVQGVVLSAAVAYVNWLTARAVARVGEEALRQAEARQKNARDRFEAGQGIRYHVLKAETDAALAALQKIKSANAARNALQELEFVTGTVFPDSVAAPDSLEGAALPALPPLDSAVALSLRSRPELLSARCRAEAALAQSRAAQLARFPALTGNGAYGLRALDSLDGELRQGWSLGLSLNFPLFTGGALQGAAHQAGGASKGAAAALRTAEQFVALDVRQQHAACQEASERMVISAQAVEQAALALSFAEERFRLGSGDPLEVSDAELSYENARIARIQALGDTRIAFMRLERAQGILAIPGNP